MKSAEGMKRLAIQVLVLGILGLSGLSGCAGPSKSAPPGRQNPVAEALAEAALKEASDQPQLPELGEEAKLDDYLLYAALNNPGLMAAFERWKAALQKIPQVRALPDPRFTYAYFFQSVETRVGPQNQRFAISQTFPWLSKLSLRGDVAWEEALAQKARYDVAKLKLIFDVKKAYYEYYYVGRAIAVTQENLQLLSYLEQAARTQYAAGMTPYANILRIQVELDKLDDRLRSLEDLKSPVAAKLNAALNRSPQEPLPVPTTIPKDEASFTDEELLAWFEENNPELKALDFAAAKEKVSIDLAEKEYFPDVTLGLDVTDTGEALNPSTPDSGKDPVVGSVSINLPIWFSKYRAGVSEAQARHAGAVKSRQDRENNLAADIKLALYGFRDAKRKMDLYQEALLPKAHQSVEVSFQDYETFMGSFLDVIDAQRTLLELQLAYERALADRQQRLAELEMLVGRTLSAHDEQTTHGDPS